MRVALALAGLATCLATCLAACKERGTITIDLSLSTCPSATPTLVRFQAIKNGSCNACSCGSCVCENTSEQQCIADVPCSGSGCPIEDARANGIDFDPPSAGRYALTYEFLDGAAGPAARVVAAICTNITVDADGTTSSSAAPPPTCCM